MRGWIGAGKDRAAISIVPFVTTVLASTNPGTSDEHAVHARWLGDGAAVRMVRLSDPSSRPIMSRKKLIQPGEKVGLKLIQAQRSLLLDALLLVPKEVERAIRTTPAHEPLMFTLDDLDDLAGHVAAGANHAG
jgi:hypothetical protein